MNEFYKELEKLVITDLEKCIEENGISISYISGDSNTCKVVDNVATIKLTLGNKFSSHLHELLHAYIISIGAPNYDKIKQQLIPDNFILHQLLVKVLNDFHHKIFHKDFIKLISKGGNTSSTIRDLISNSTSYENDHLHFSRKCDSILEENKGFRRLYRFYEVYTSLVYDKLFFNSRLDYNKLRNINNELFDIIDDLFNSYNFGKYNYDDEIKLFISRMETYCKKW